MIDNQATKERLYKEIEYWRRYAEGLRNLLQGADSGTWEWNVQNGKLVLNDRWAQIVGSGLDELEPVSIKTWEALAHPDDWKQSSQLLERHFAGEIPFHDIECRLKHKNGHWVRVRSRGQVVSWTDDGKPLMMYGTLADITGRRRTEEALQQSEEHLRSVVRAAPTGIGVVIDRVLKQVNQRMCEITGYPEEELIGQNARMLYVTDEDFEYVGREKYAQIRDHGTGSVETRLLRKDGQIIDVLLSSTPMDPADLSRGVVFTALDITERKRAERERERAQEFMQTVIDGLSESVMVINRDYTMALANRTLRETAAEPDPVAAGLKCHQIFYKSEVPCQGAEIPCPLERVIASRATVTVEHIHHDAAGHAFPVEIIAAPIFDDKGEVIQIVESCRNITCQKKSEEALQESEKRFRDLTELLPEAIFETDRGMNLTYANQRAFDLFKYTKEDFETGLDGFEMIAPVDRERARANMNLRLTGEDPGAVEYLASRKDGTTFPVLFHASAIVKDGEFVGCRGIIVDITERKHAEEKLKESEEKYRLTFETAATLITSVDAEGRLVDCNSIVEEVLGYDRNEMIGQSRNKIIHPDYHATAQESLKELIATGAAGSKEYKMVRKDGRPIDVSLTSSSITDKQGRFVRSICIITDITERKRAEEKLRQDEHLLRKMAENYPNSYVSIITRDFTIGFTSGQEFKKQNLDPEQFVGQTLDQVFGDKAPVVRKHYEETFSGKECTFELFIYGQYQLYRTVPLYSEDGSVPRILVVVENVTEHRLADQALKASEESYRSLIDNIPDVVWTADENGHTTFISDNVTDVYGYTPDEIYKGGDSLFLGRVHPEDVGRIRSAFRALLKDGISYDVEYRIERKDGRWIWLHDRALKAYSKKGQMRVDGVFSDITEYKLAENMLRESEKKFKSITERISDVIIRVSPEGDIVYVSPSVSRAFGYEPSELVGKNIMELVPQGQVPEVIDVLALNAAGKTVEGAKAEIYRKDGGIAYITLDTVPINEDEKIIGTQAIIRDITETKRLMELESRAERLETAGTIAGQVAHDFNNLLAPLMAYPEFVRDELPHDNKAHAYLDAIENAANKIADINQDLLTMGRRGHYNQNIFNINRIVLQAAQEMESRTTNVSIEMNLCQDLMNIKGGAAQLHRILTNVLVNAEDAMQGIGRVSIRTENYYADDTSIAFGRIPKGEYVKLTISDNGCGIPDNMLQKIFDPFFTTKTADKRRGSGLGLSVVDAVIRDHRGYLDLESKVGQGTSFYFYFPATREGTERDEHRQLAIGSETILVVDDDDIQRDVSLHLLAKLGYNASSVVSGEAAIEYLRENSVDLVILDMVMPGGIDGAETYRRIHDMNPFQKAIFLSGFSESGRIFEAQKLGAGAFVKKPITKKAIAAAVRAELDRQVESTRS